MRRQNTHGTDVCAEREVAYRWHPWAGRIVRIHEVIEKAGGAVARCSVANVHSDRLMELPVRIPGSSGQ